MDLDTILTTALQHDASDIHLVTGHKPMARVHTVMMPMDYPMLTKESTTAMLEHMATPEHMKVFNKVKDVDFSYAIKDIGRFRVNAHMQRGTVGISLRSIKTVIPELESLNLPEVISRLTYLPRGLVLVTGDTGSGKSTTLAAMIDQMNYRYQKHIITLEDPIEYTMSSAKCIIEQRELGEDTPSFASGLRHVLRQDPDIILVGEMRDLETTAAAITAAETGHLVFSTLHTVNASQTIERIIDMYPADEQNQIRSMLANTLQAVVSQTLFKRLDTKGMVPAVEIMLCTPAVRNLIRENRAFEIPNVIDTNRSLGMNSLDSAISELYFNGMISREDAIAQAAFPEKIERALAA
ncbi:Twitching mobility protein [Poriferisphaera corsica]|uniref:Twitching mobility protein n=1 Tax=Poriferisphaera corsica TaxID=2528020 RepID=A0A517YXJ4_9BACT|nr:PilT/PilU family type 4a pilus ATPase [Poriferisphaera corsica]QDU34948.1 Twitching mobility protein [Poriferisphaera corsica]